MEIRMIVLLVLIPVISAFIGWLTNYIAIKSLFKPVHKKSFLFFKFQGVIPKRKKVLANNIAEVVEKYLFSHKDILKEFERPENIKKIKRKILPIIENRILEKVPSMFRSIAEPIVKSVLEKEIDSLILQINAELGSHLLDSIDIKKIISKKINEYDISNLEDIIYGIAAKELKHVEYLGGLIGFVVGLLQVGIMMIL